ASAGSCTRHLIADPGGSPPGLKSNAVTGPSLTAAVRRSHGPRQKIRNTPYGVFRIFIVPAWETSHPFDRFQGARSGGASPSVCSSRKALRNILPTLLRGRSCRKTTCRGHL